MTTNEGPRDLSARFNFGSSARRDQRVRDQRARDLAALIAALPTMTEDEAYAARNAAKIGTNGKRQVRELIEARFGRTYQTWKATH